MSLTKKKTQKDATKKELQKIANMIWYTHGISAGIHNQIDDDDD